MVDRGLLELLQLFELLELLELHLLGLLLCLALNHAGLLYKLLRRDE